MFQKTFQSIDTKGRLAIDTRLYEVIQTSIGIEVTIELNTEETELLLRQPKKFDLFTHTIDKQKSGYRLQLPIKLLQILFKDPNYRSKKEVVDINYETKEQGQEMIFRLKFRRSQEPR